VQIEKNDMFMFFVDSDTNNVDIRKVVWKLEQLQQRINERDVDQVIDTVLNGVFNNDLTKIEPCVNGPEVSNLRCFGITLVGG
jgi:hypothetical protein